MNSKQESLETILNKYNRLCARYRDLEQQSVERQEKWKEIEREFKINEALTRDLCELILAKDPKEMVLGTEYSWGKLKTRDIIERSKNVFTSYNEARTQLLKDIQKQSEERRVMIENLQTQIEQDLHARQQLEQLHQENPENAKQTENSTASFEVDPATGEVLNFDVSEKAKGRAAYSIQQAAQRGDVSLVHYEDDDTEEVVSNTIPDNKPPITQEDIHHGREQQNKSSKKKVKVSDSLRIVEENKDVSKTEVMLQSELSAAAQELSLERSGAHITPSVKKLQVLQQNRQAAAPKTMQVDVSVIEQKLNDRSWYLLEAVGSTGLCEGSEIIDAVISSHPDESFTNNGLRYELMSLSNNGCLLADMSIAHPTKSRFAVYTLSDIGRRLYISRFGKDPVVSERDKLIADHDNLEHAFGIKCLKHALEISGEYSNVSMERQSNTVRLQDGTSYIADITATMQGRSKPFTIYMEYERGTHHQADFNIKLNKAAKVTRHIDIVCPNAATVTNLRDKVSKWVESRGGGKALPGVRVRITTLRRLDGRKGINKDENWQIVFDLPHGDTPIERK